jgi:iron uptake system EfeUOB component EfeO/EfeM
VSWRWGRLAALVLVVAVAAGCGDVARMGVLAVGESGCGSPPRGLPAGPVALPVTDQAVAFVSVYLIDPAEDVYAELPSLAPGATLPLSTTLAAGTYALRCVFTDATVRTSPEFTVTGSTTGAVHGYRPMPDLAMTAPVTTYRAQVRAALPGLLAASRRLDADVARADLAAARADWLGAHLDYERLGAAYTSFGDFDAMLDGTADGLPDGTATAGWTGFHAVEYALWHGATAARVRPMTRTIVATVGALVTDFRSEEIDPGDLPLRAHEILENSLQFQLTGAADYGSGTTLATAYANTQGTRGVLTALLPLVTPRDPTLPGTIDADLARVQSDLLAARSDLGVWTPPRALPTARRRQLDGDMGFLLEHLAVLPGLLAPRTSG